MGVSVYIGKQPLQQDLDYIKQASQLGFCRIFSCFLHANTGSSQFLQDFKQFMDYAKKLNFEVFIDVSPALLKSLNIDFNNLELFKNLGVTGLRLDEGFSGLEESIISFSSNLQVEINASNGTKTLDNIISYQANKSNLVACHNFYPRRYTGLSLPYFLQCSHNIKKHGLRLASFVASQNKNTFFSQNLMEGLPTLEHHRNLPLINQAKEMYYCGLIDDVIVSNAYASITELQQLSALNKDIITLDVMLNSQATDLDADMIANNLHFNRGDTSEYVIRSTQLRIKYANCNIAPANTSAIEIGDITIDNNLYGKYKGELHIARKPMQNSGNVNVVAKIVDLDIALLSYIKPWTKFKLNIVK